MTTRILPDETTLQIDRVEQGSPHQVFISHQLLRTEPTSNFQCQPVSRISPVITWDGVILPLQVRLAELRSIPEEQRWPGADWPTEEAFQDAGKFTELLPKPLNSDPHISLANDGEVNFAWFRDGTWIDLGFYGTGTYSFYARDKSGDEWFGDDISVTSPLPKELRALLAG